VIPLLLALAVPPAPTAWPKGDLGLYLATAAAYGAGNRNAALREIRQWGAFEISRATGALREEEKRLRSEVKLPTEIAFSTVEAAVLLHAEAGLIYLQEQRPPAAKRHFDASTALLRWSRGAAARARNRTIVRGKVFDDVPDEPRQELRESIDVRDFYVALASASLALGYPETAVPFAGKARAEAPRDAAVQLVLGCAAEGLAVERALLHRDGDASRARRDAEAAFREALALAPETLEARLRLGKLLQDGPHAIEAEPLLAAAEAAATDDRQRYLARLFLGRAQERLGRSDEAIRSYRRAFAAWPDSQAARLALAHALERSSGPAASRGLVQTLLDPIRRPDARPDPWFVYPVGPPGLAQAAFNRVFERQSGP
jgi:tetratricopeptide (TPR) repeat protein